MRFVRAMLQNLGMNHFLDFACRTQYLQNSQRTIGKKGRKSFKREHKTGIFNLSQKMIKILIKRTL